MTGNPNLREALALARRMGCSVDPVNRTGEVKITPPAGGPPVVCNGRRKDTPRVLIKALRRLEREGS